MEKLYIRFLIKDEGTMERCAYGLTLVVAVFIDIQMGSLHMMDAIRRYGHVEWTDEWMSARRR